MIQRPDPRFMFRDQELARVAHVLAQGQSVLLVGIRRTGKTQLMKAALQQQAAIGPVVYLDVSDQIHLQSFYRSLLQALPKGLMQQAVDAIKTAGKLPDALLKWLRSHVDKAEVLGQSIDFNPPGDLLQRYWEPVAEAVLTAAQQESDPARLPVIGIDELPFMLQNLLDRQVSVADITVALATLRKLRDAGLRMIIGGSISMENLLTLHHIPHTVLGGLKREVVRPFTRDEAQAYLSKHLAARPALAAISTALDALPDHVPDFLDECCRFLRPLPQASEVAQAMDELVLPAIRRSFVRQFEERLAKFYLGADLASAEAILDQLARVAAAGGRLDGSQLPAGYQTVLVKLQFDMFVDEAQGYDWRFSLNVLRQWWRATRGIA